MCQTGLLAQIDIFCKQKKTKQKKRETFSLLEGENNSRKNIEYEMHDD